MLLAHCALDQKRLQLNLLKPFSALVNATKSSNWLALADELRTDSVDYDDKRLTLIKEILVS